MFNRTEHDIEPDREEYERLLAIPFTSFSVPVYHREHINLTATEILPTHEQGTMVRKCGACKEYQLKRGDQ